MKTRSLTTLLLAGLIGIYSCKEELIETPTLPPKGNAKLIITDSLGNIVKESSHEQVLTANALKTNTWAKPLSYIAFHATMPEIELSENHSALYLSPGIHGYQPYIPRLDTFFFTPTPSLKARLYDSEEIGPENKDDLDSLEALAIKMFFQCPEFKPLQDSVMVNFTYIGEPFYGEQYGARHRLREYHFNYEFPALYPGLGTYTLRYEVEAVFRRNIKGE